MTAATPLREMAHISFLERRKNKTKMPHGISASMKSLILCVVD